jgi:hypothetical protein
LYPSVRQPIDSLDSRKDFLFLLTLQTAEKSIFSSHKKPLSGVAVAGGCSVMPLSSIAVDAMVLSYIPLVDKKCLG